MIEVVQVDKSDQPKPTLKANNSAPAFDGCKFAKVNSAGFLVGDTHQ
jgi:hypothetical protein